MASSGETSDMSSSEVEGVTKNLLWVSLTDAGRESVGKRHETTASLALHPRTVHEIVDRLVRAGGSLMYKMDENKRLISDDLAIVRARLNDVLACIAVKSLVVDDAQSQESAITNTSDEYNSALVRIRKAEGYLQTLANAEQCRRLLK